LFSIVESRFFASDFMRLGEKPGYEGPLRTARQALADRFRFWRGVSGRRYVCSVFSPQSVPAYEPAVALYVRRGPAGPSLIAVAVGNEQPHAEADEVHVHLLRAGPDAATRALGDLAPLIRTVMPVESARRVA
jgi:hypothetical protein